MFPALGIREYDYLVYSVSSLLTVSFIFIINLVRRRNENRRGERRR
jgi:hypothetical protein